MRRETIRKLLRNYKNVVFTKKAEIRCVQRGIDKKLVEDNVLNPRSLIYVIDEGQPTTYEHKYKLGFRLSNARTLIVRITINKRIKIITSYIILNKVQKGLWLRWTK